MINSEYTYIPLPSVGIMKLLKLGDYYIFTEHRGYFENNVYACPYLILCFLEPERE